MPMANLQYKSKIFQPAAVATPETTAVFAVKAGTRVWAAGAKALIAAAASTDSTMALGDGTSTAGYIAAIDLEATAAGTIVNGQGALLNQSGGKLYTADDTIDVVYAVPSAGGATNPRYVFWIVVSRESPGPGPV